MRRRGDHRASWACLALLLTVGGGAVLTACGSVQSQRAAGGRLRVVAAESCWGSIAAQLGGDKVQVTRIISNPNADPHDYEPAPSDARAVADAQLVIVNGVGYDSWASKLVSADGRTGQQVLNVGTLVNVPDGGNPHRWYDPTDVRTVMARLTADYKRADPGDSAYFDREYAATVQRSFRAYFAELEAIKARYAGTPIGASESIVAPLAAYLGLDLRTPPSFLRAISEGTDPSAADKATIDRQLAERAIRVYVYNSQNSTPDVQAQVADARRRGIPVVEVTETLSPRNATFEQWQLAQLRDLAAALAQGVRT